MSIKKQRIVDRGYIYISNPLHPKARGTSGYVAEHVLIIEEHLGRYLFDNEVVHHRDRNRSNNTLGNLQVMTQSEHAKIHAQAPKVIELTCSNCGKIFTKRYNQYITKSTKYSQKDFYCNRRCMGSAFGNYRPKNY